MNDLRPRVLVVEDHAADRVLCERAFDTVDYIPTVSQLETAIGVGERWDLAFVDFHLGEQVPSGLSAMRSLLASGCKVVAYTPMGESGRTLFAAAARHWLGVKLVVSKDFASESVLRAYAVAALTGAQAPTPRNIANQMHNAQLIDRLIPNGERLRMWRLLHHFAGAETPISRELGISRRTLNEWKADALDAVLDVLEKLFGQPRPPEGDRRNFAILLNFASEHRMFFFAVDLPKFVDERRTDGPTA